VKENSDSIVNIIHHADAGVLSENWGVAINSQSERVFTWCKCVAKLSNIDDDLAMDILTQIIKKQNGAVP
jgi:hypothetical protein